VADGLAEVSHKREDVLAAIREAFLADLDETPAEE
jgi:hypothetical protein